MFFSICRDVIALRRNPIRSIASRDKFSLARSAFSGPVLFLSTPMPPWHHCVIDIAPIHLALLFHTSRTICGSVMIDFWLPRAKMCCFSANYDSRAGTTRRYDGPRRSNRGSMKFNTVGETIFLRLPRSYRVAEKFSQIGSREPNYAVFQQNPIVVTAELDAPMDPDAINSQA